MTSQNKDIGYLGEHLAKEFLLKNDYKILSSNYNTKLGEIDLICFKNDIVIFVEVKSRYSLNYGMPLESVSSSKINRIKKVAKYYLYTNNIYYSYYIRFDIIEVFFNYIDNSYKINHSLDAFR